MLIEEREKRKDQRSAGAPSTERKYEAGDFVSLRSVSPTKGQAKWIPGYKVLSEYQGGLRLLEIETGRVLRANRRRVRLIPEQKPYDEVDPLPARAKAVPEADPSPEVPIPLEPNTFIPIAPAALLRPGPMGTRDTVWLQWLEVVHQSTNE